MTDLPEDGRTEALRHLNDLMGYLNWYEATPAAQLRESNIRSFAWKALRALDDPGIRAYEEQVRPHEFVERGDDFCGRCRWLRGHGPHPAVHRVEAEPITQED